MRIIVLLLALLVVEAAGAQDRLAWNPGADTFQIAIPEGGWSMEADVAELDSVTVVNLPTVYEGRRLTGALYGATDTLRVVPDGVGVYGIDIVGASREVAIHFAFQQAPAGRFDAAYRRVHEGTARIEIPEVYELVQILMALTPTGRDTTNVLVWREGPYYERVMAHFGPFAGHPAVAGMERLLQDGKYVSTRANARAYRFEGAHILPDTTYLALSFGKDRLDALMPQIEAFAEASGFRAFYAARQAEYARLLAEMEALLPVERMWRWLEAEFPARSQSFLTLVSPLTYGTHSATTLEDGDYRESVVFLPGPGVLDDAFGSIVGDGTSDWREVEMGRIAFTEFDHPYVDPSALPLADRIEAAMADLDAWNRLPLYRSASKTFGEYMTWAVFLLYVDDHYPADTAAEAREGVVRFMEQNRGFVRFGAFLDELTLRYGARADGETIAELMPGLVDWMEQQ